MKVDAAEQQKTADVPKTELGSSNVDLKEIPGLPRTAAMAAIEQALHVALKSITPGVSEVDVLVRNLAQARLEAAFGYIYARIFGSQIACLADLEARRRIDTDEAYRFYLEVEKKYPEVYAGYGFAGWVGFLKNHALVQQSGDYVAITDRGEDFLRWLRAYQLSANKPF